jgi:hypothetical protein
MNQQTMMMLGVPVIFAVIMMIIRQQQQQTHKQEFLVMGTIATAIAFRAMGVPFFV